jgi:1-acyl-sn-glycerol-3-phosphate acyltransferase
VSPVRFFWRLARGLVWFAVASVRVLRTAPGDGTTDYDLTHRYGAILSSGWNRIFRMRHQIRNGERILAAQPCIYIANHRSNLDVLTMCGIFPPRAIVIGKREILRVPLLGKIFRVGGNVPINRRDPEEARVAMETAEEKLRRDRLSIFIMPEGTRNYGTLLPFKKGAFHLARNTGLRILPMVCAAPPRWLDGKRLWLAPHVHVLIQVLDPVDPAEFDTVDSLIETTRDRMAAALAQLEAELVRT